MGHGGEFWQNMVHCKREWQTTSAFLPWEPHEQYEKAKRYDNERYPPPPTPGLYVSNMFLEKSREIAPERRKGTIYPCERRVPKIARRDKKAFLSDQCKEIEENSRIGKTRDLFKKIRDTKGKFFAKMGTIKDRNGMDLTEAEDIKKRWQEYTGLTK